MDNQGRILAKAYMDAYEEVFGRYGDGEFADRVAMTVVFSLAIRPDFKSVTKRVEDMTSDEFFTMISRGKKPVDFKCEGLV